MHSIAIKTMAPKPLTHSIPTQSPSSVVSNNLSITLPQLSSSPTFCLEHHKCLNTSVRHGSGGGGTSSVARA